MIRKVSWGDVRVSVAAANQELARALDTLLNSTRFREQKPDLFVAEYGYSELIVDRGDFRPPCHRTHPRESHCPLCRPLMNAVQYSAIPLGLCLNRSVEVFLETEWDKDEPRMAPLRLIGPGEPFGVFEVLDTLLGTPFPKPPWSVGAGARSVWILAPLGHMDLPDRLSKLVNRKIRNVKDARPCELIAQVAAESWRAEILLFPDSLLNDLQPEDELFRVLMKTGWRQSSGVRHALFRVPQDLIQSVSSIGGPLPDLYRIATVRHLMDAAKGEVPVFSPVVNGKALTGPFLTFQNVLRQALDELDSEYLPVVMQPTHLENRGDVGYYSFRCPTVVGVKRPYIKNYGDVPACIREDMMAQPSSCEMIDGSTQYFAQKSKDDVIASTELPVSEFYPKDINPKLYLKSTFMISGVRLVRATARVQPTVHGI